jgi:hypothetical protein
VNGDVMVVFVFVVGDMVMLVNGGAMVVAGFMVDDVPMIVMCEIRSPYCHIGEARKSMRATKQWGLSSLQCRKWFLDYQTV